MTSMTGWFIAGLVVILILAMYAPRFAGMLVILIALYLALHKDQPYLQGVNI